MDLFATRRAGVLLHPTSLPGLGSRGKLGADARRFVDWLAAGAFSVWQTLPLGVPDAYGSPYGLRSAYAGDPELIDSADLEAVERLPARIDAAGDRTARYASFAAHATVEQRHAFAKFLRRRRRWLLPYGLFELMSARFGGAPWWQWPAEYRDIEPTALRDCLARNRSQLRALYFEQYLFELQWFAL
ncbi:MAG TPA: 4-alpha-glucanotransferase, partial [Gammaproteobacteria bacterium]